MAHDHWCSHDNQHKNDASCRINFNNHVIHSSFIHSCFMFHSSFMCFFFLIWLVSQYWTYSQTLSIKIFSPTSMPTHYCSIKASYGTNKWMFSYTYVPMQLGIWKDLTIFHYLSWSFSFAIEFPSPSTHVRIFHPKLNGSKGLLPLDFSCSPRPISHSHHQLHVANTL